MDIFDIKRCLVDEFHPSRVISSSGHEYVVYHPDCVMVGPYALAILDKDGHLVTLGHDHVVAIKIEPVKKNEAKKR
jgi:hypothetical protein